MKLKEKICREEHIFFVNGGYEFNGAEISKIQKDEILKIGEKLVEDFETKKIEIINLVISGIFSPINPNQEKEVSKILESYFHQKKIPFILTICSDISQLGILERENASILNASLTPLAYKTIKSFQNALVELKLEHSQLYLTQNDGTLINCERAKKFPVLTFSSGPVNSGRGASFLTGIKDAIFLDCGGTTLDVGVIVNGFPRLSQTTCNVGGVRTSFRLNIFFF